MAKLALVEKTRPVLRLLLVEDNESDAFVTENLLSEMSAAEFRTHHARTQAEALQMLSEREFDVCLLDLTLPDADSFSALIGIQEKAPDMPVLILTGFNDADTAKRAVGRGAQDYLLKDELAMAALGRSIDYAITRKRMEKTLFERANHDALTGLFNRGMFENRLALALSRKERSGAGVAVLFIDLDGFKPVNDRHGHDAGDEALKIVAARLQKSLRAYDTPARLGGDEFAVLLEGVASPRDAAVIAQKIIHQIAQPIPYRGRMLSLGASVGIALAGNAPSADTLLHHADIAMYHAKQEGGGYRFYSRNMQNATHLRLQLEKDLRAALEKEELKLHYQPYVAPGGEAVLGVETLLRWASPERGMLEPHEFLPAAEAGRLMPEISAWMGKALRRDIAAWNAANLPPLEIAVNLSLSQIDSPELLHWLTPLAQEDFLGNHRLAAEIPEEALASLTESRFITLAKLGERGVLLHLDHFGSGATSLQTLSALPFSLLKIDASLIRRLNDEARDDALIRAAIMLAHQLGMKAGAVGVETQLQMRALQEQHCDVMQGFLTARPMTARQLTEWLTAECKKPAA